MTYFSLIDSLFNWLRSKCVYWQGYLDYHAHIVCDIAITKITAEFRRISHCFGMIWHGWIQSPAVSKRYDIRWPNFGQPIPLSIDYFWNFCIGNSISTPSCSYCVWNSCCQNHSRNLPNFPLFSMILCGWIQSSAVRKRQDARCAVFAGLFRYQWTMFEIRLLIGLSHSFMVILRMK